MGRGIDMGPQVSVHVQEGQVERIALGPKEERLAGELGIAREG
jgi:hypothetical protein